MRFCSDLADFSVPAFVYYLIIAIFWDWQRAGANDAQPAMLALAAFNSFGDADFGWRDGNEQQVLDRNVWKGSLNEVLP